MGFCDFIFERKQELKLLAKSPSVLWIILFANMLESFSYFVISMNFILFISEQYEFSDQEAGIYYSGWGIAISVWGIGTAFIGDALGPGISIAISTVISCGARFIFCFFDEKLMFYIATFIVMPIGISWGIPVFRVAVKRCTNTKTKTLIYGLFYTSMNVGAFLSGTFITAIEKNITKEHGITLFNHKYSPTQFMFLIASAVTFVNFFFGLIILRKFKTMNLEELGKEDNNIIIPNGDNKYRWINEDVERESDSDYIPMRSLKTFDGHSTTEDVNLAEVRTTIIHDTILNNEYYNESLQNNYSNKNKDKVEHNSDPPPYNESFKNIRSTPKSVDQTIEDRQIERLAFEEEPESTILVRKKRIHTLKNKKSNNNEEFSLVTDDEEDEEEEDEEEKDIDYENGDKKIFSEKKSGQQSSCCCCCSWMCTCDDMKKTMKNKFLYKVVLMNLTMLFVRTLFRHLDATFPKYIKRSFDPSVPFASLLSVNPILIIFLVPLFQSLTSGSKTYVWIIVGSFISAISVFSMAFGPELWLVFIFLILFSIGEAIYSPKIDDYTMTLSPNGQEMLFSMLSSLPLFFTKFIVGPFSGYVLTEYCAADEIILNTRNTTEYESKIPITLSTTGGQHINTTVSLTTTVYNTMTKMVARDCEMMWFIIGCTSIITPFLLLVFKNYLNSDQVKDMLSKNYYKFHRLPETDHLDIDKTETVDEFVTRSIHNVPTPTFDNIYDDAESIDEQIEELQKKPKRSSQNKSGKKRKKKSIQNPIKNE